MKVDIDVNQLRDLEKYLLGMEKRVEDFTIPLTKGAKRMYDDVVTNWNSAGAFFGQPWDEHAEATVDRWGPHSLLRLSGKLFGSLRYFVGKFSAGVFTKAPHAHLHDKGTEQFGKTHNPTRVILHIKPEAVDLLMELILDYAVAEQELAAA